MKKVLSIENYFFKIYRKAVKNNAIHFIFGTVKLKNAKTTSSSLEDSLRCRAVGRLEQLQVHVARWLNVPGQDVPSFGNPF